MSSFYDVAIIGLGAMGSTAARFLARHRKSLIAFDPHLPPHQFGSSHGRSRIIRETYFEHPIYVPMVRRAYELWRDMEHESGGRIFFRRTGGLMIGAESSQLVQGALKSAIANRIPHEILSAGKLHRRFPAFAPLEDMIAVYETRAGVLLPDQIITANLEFAKRHGAALHTDEAVQGWDVTSDGVEVRTARDRYRARHLIIAAGAWIPELLGDAAAPLQVERQLSHWMEPSRFPEWFTPENMPVSLWELSSGRLFFTIPDLGDGVKIGFHHGGAATTPAALAKRITPEEDAAIFDILRRFVPMAKGEIRDRSVCMYTNTPDHHFVIDRHPSSDSVFVVSACSGHGFKFAPVIAELLTAWVDGSPPRIDPSLFSLSRFAS